MSSSLSAAETVRGSADSCCDEVWTSQQSVLKWRRKQLLHFCNPLPGSVPAVSVRPINVPGRFDGMELIDFLCLRFPAVARREWQDKIAAGAVIDAPHERKSEPDPVPVHLCCGVRLGANQLVFGGNQFLHIRADTVEPPVNPNIEFLYEDDDLIVVSKPAPLPVHSSGRFHRNTLQWLLNHVYQPEKPRLVHRLDANTSGVMVLCRSRDAARFVQRQFAARTVHKQYLARVSGHPSEQDFECQAPVSRTPGPQGVRSIDPSGRSALTRFSVLQKLPDGSALVRVVPVTGRTNQIRLHLWDLGWPVLNDPVYQPDGTVSTNRTLTVNEPAMQLHARSLSFRLPCGRDATFLAPLPQWCPTAPDDEG